MVDRLKKSYAQVVKRIGDPLDADTLYAPLHSQNAIDQYVNTIKKAVAAGGQIEFGGNVRHQQNNIICTHYIDYFNTCTTFRQEGTEILLKKFIVQ